MKMTTMNTNTNKMFIYVLLSLYIFSAMSGVMQITLNNLKNVLATYQQVHVLFHNPQCVHSRKYVQQFLKITTNQQTKLGIVDCIRQVQLCQQHNLTLFPVLATYSINTNNENNNNNNNVFQLIDQQQFLVKHNIKTQFEDQVMANRFVTLLTQEPYFVTVIFQDHGLPVIQQQRIQQQQQNQQNTQQSQQIQVFYLQPYHLQQNPSQFTKLLSSFVYNRHGCWIFTKSPQTDQLLKYACDSGYSKNITLKFVKLFKQGKLKKYTLQRQVQQGQYSQQQQQNNIMITNINTQQMIKVLPSNNKNTNLIDPCGLVYVSSKHCVSCKQDKDINIILTAIKSLGLQTKLQVFKFNIDNNQIPSELVKYGLKRVPELLHVCERKVNVFGKVLMVENIIDFIQKTKKVNANVSQNTQDKAQQTSVPQSQKQF